MCGIIGILNLTESPPIQNLDLRQMLAMIRHRGPDEFGIYIDRDIGLGNARLSIIDLTGGEQPISNEDGTMWIVYNGEIFNYVELRPELEKRGHHFSTDTDTEVILHLYEDHGPDCLQFLNGQFAISIWDESKHNLFLARDRIGIRPLFYTIQNGKLIFGSEIKSILAHPEITADIDLVSLDQIFTYWSPLSPRTVFKGIYELSPGHYLLSNEGHYQIKPYWSLDFTRESSHEKNDREYLDEFEDLLVDAAQIRLRADVPVGAYLSGGLDSSTIAAIIQNYTDIHLDTFSISFCDAEFDESQYQMYMANYLGTEHQVVSIHHENIGDIFPQVIWHTEVPILRTAPAPMYALSKLVQDHKYKVVLTGEGADEFLAGYNIFKEMKIRRFWAQHPDSQTRPLLLSRLYPHISKMPKSTTYLASFFGKGLTETDSWDYSHSNRWRTTSRTKRFFSERVNQEVTKKKHISDYEINFPKGYSNWDALSQAQYLESTIFLPGYLLSSQGDRMGMAHSVEGRFPFLDHRVVDFCIHLPPHLKMYGLNEKYILKKLSRKWLPKEISARSKQPYRAPINRSFFNEAPPAYVTELLSERSIKSTDIFKPQSVNQLVRKIDEGRQLSETDDMALAGIISSQLVFKQFVHDFKMPPPLTEGEIKKVVINHRSPH